MQKQVLEQLILPFSQKMALARPWRQLHLVAILELDLWVEILTDLVSMFVLLYLASLTGYLIHPAGWLAVWVRLVDGQDAHMVYVVGNVLVLLMVYWVPAIIYTLVQREEAQTELSMVVMARVVGMVVLNQVVQGIIGGEVAWRWRYQYINMDMPLVEVPTFKR
jgi:hypothetical protein